MVNTWTARFPYIEIIWDISVWEIEGCMTFQLPIVPRHWNIQKRDRRFASILRNGSSCCVDFDARSIGECSKPFTPTVRYDTYCLFVLHLQLCDLHSPALTAQWLTATLTYSSVTYRLTDNKLNMWSTSNDRIEDGLLTMFSPSSNDTWIGINWRALPSSAASWGSGICRAVCETINAFQAQPLSPAGKIQCRKFHPAETYGTWDLKNFGNFLFPALKLLKIWSLEEVLRILEKLQGQEIDNYENFS